MTVTRLTESAVFDGLTGLTADKVLTLPTHAAGNLLVAMAAWKDFAITAQITDSGWAEITEFADGAVATGNGIGSMKVAAWYKAATSSSETSPTLDFSTTVGLVGEAVIIVLGRSLDAWSTPTFVTAAWPSSASQTVSSSSTVTVPDGSLILSIFGVRDDGVPSSGRTIGASGVTFTASTTTEGAESTTTGNDMAVCMDHRRVTTGAAAQTLTFNATIPAAETGAVLWVVVNDVAVAGNPPYRSPYPPILAQ